MYEIKLISKNISDFMLEKCPLSGFKKEHQLQPDKCISLELYFLLYAN